MILLPSLLALALASTSVAGAPAAVPMPARLPRGQMAGLYGEEAERVAATMGMAGALSLQQRPLVKGNAIERKRRLDNPTGGARRRDVKSCKHASELTQAERRSRRALSNVRRSHAALEEAQAKHLRERSTRGRRGRTFGKQEGDREVMRKRKLPSSGVPGFVEIAAPLFQTSLSKSVAGLVFSLSNSSTSSSDPTFDLGTSKSHSTQFILTPAAGSFPDGMVVVDLRVPMLNSQTLASDDYCATFDIKPPSPLSLQKCGTKEGYSQNFAFNTTTGELQPLYSNGDASASGVAAPKLSTKMVNMANANATSSSSSGNTTTVAKSGNSTSPAAAANSTAAPAPSSTNSTQLPVNSAAATSETHKLLAKPRVETNVGALEKGAKSFDADSDSDGDVSSPSSRQLASTSPDSAADDVDSTLPRKPTTVPTSAADLANGMDKPASPLASDDSDSDLAPAPKKKESKPSAAASAAASDKADKDGETNAEASPASVSLFFVPADAFYSLGDVAQLAAAASDSNNLSKSMNDKVPDETFAPKSKATKSSDSSKDASAATSDAEDDGTEPTTADAPTSASSTKAAPTSTKSPKAVKTKAVKNLMVEEDSASATSTPCPMTKTASADEAKPTGMTEKEKQGMEFLQNAGMRL